MFYIDSESLIDLSLRFFFGLTLWLGFLLVVWLFLYLISYFIFKIEFTPHVPATILTIATGIVLFVAAIEKQGWNSLMWLDIEYIQDMYNSFFCSAQFQQFMDKALKITVVFAFIFISGFFVYQWLASIKERRQEFRDFFRQQSKQKREWEEKWRQKYELSEEEKKLRRCYYTLGLIPHAPDMEVKKKYRELAKITHPDHGGNAEDFRLITDAYNEIRSNG